MDRYEIIDEQIRTYQEFGYIQLPDVLTDGELERLRRGFDFAVAERERLEHSSSRSDSDYASVFLQMVNLWEHVEDIRRHTFSPKIAEIARQLARKKAIRLWHDHALIKPAGKQSKASAWHQDLPYWPLKESGPGQALSCWMAVDDVTVESGCMQFVPKSHLWGRLDPINLSQPQNIFDYVDEPENKDFTPIPVEMSAGSCTFHNGLTFHYAGPNQADRPRRAMVTIYMPHGTTYSGKGHVCTDRRSGVLTVGELLEGDLFPVLANA